MIIILFGPPGAGKGTQSNFIVKKYNLFQISTGKILREEIKNNSELGQKISSLMSSGFLVADEIVNKLIEDIVSNKKFHSKFGPLVIEDGDARIQVSPEILIDTNFLSNIEINRKSYKFIWKTATSSKTICVFCFF